MRLIPALLVIATVLGAFHKPARSTSIKSTNPTQYQLSVGAATDVTASFDTLLSAASVNDTTLLVYSFETGKLVGVYSLSNGDSTAVFNPTSLFRAGEVLEAVATVDVTSAAGTPGTAPYVWRFTAGGTYTGESLSTYPNWFSATTEQTESMALGDYDGDGDLDLALGNAPYTSLYRNDGGFLTTTPVWTPSTSAGTRGIAWGDYDNDGDLDLALGNYNTPNTLYRNDGGTLTTIPVWSSSQNHATEAVEWGDYDGDGDLDLAFGNVGDPNTIYRNDGGTFTADPVWNSTPTVGTNSVAWGDYDGDGDLDLMCGNYFAINSLYRNDAGTLTTSPVWNSALASGTYNVAWGDYDGDGDVDLACANYGQANRIYRNDGGTLTASSVWSSTPTSYTRSVVWADYDGDGDLDLACGNANNRANNIYRNDGGNLTTGAAWSTDSTYKTVELALGDMDNDGDLDLVCANGFNEPSTAYYSASPPLIVSIDPYFSDTDVSRDTDVQVTFNEAMGPSTISDSVFVVHSFLTGKVPGSYSLTGSNEVAVMDPESTFFAGETIEAIVTDEAASLLGLRLDDPRVWRFTVEAVDDGDSLDVLPAWSDTTGYQTSSAAWADYDDDGDLDLSFGTNQGAVPNRLYRNDNGRLNPVPIAISSTSQVTRGLAWGDYDGDGDIDVACANNGANTLHENTGSSISVTPVWTSTPTNNSSSVAWGDFDGDGDLDLLFGNELQSNTIYRNDDGTITTSAVWVSTPAYETRSVLWFDSDRDGDLDVFCGNYGATESNNLYRNDAGVINTTAVWTSFTHYRTTSVAAADINGDGRAELIFGNYDQYDELYWNTGGSFSYSGWYSHPTYSTTTIAWVDYDGDGDLDLACGSWDDPVVVYRKEGSTLEQDPYWTSQDRVARNTWSIAWADFDKDGDMDFAQGNYGWNRLFVSGLVVTSTDPVANVGDVGLDADVEAAFNTPTNPTSISSDGFKVYGGQRGLLSGGHSTHTGNTYGVFDPDSSFYPGECVQAILTPAVTSASGDRLTRGRVRQFRAEVPTSDILLTNPYYSLAAGTCRDVAWGDVDQDGDLDLAVGRVGTQAVYENVGGVLSPTPLWTSSYGTISTGFVVWVDYDQDGDLDLTTGVDFVGANLHRNDGGTLTASAVWSAATGLKSAWGDYDGDGDMDIVTTDSGVPGWALYRNENGSITSSAVRSKTAGLYPTSIAWADYDYDGDLDIACGDWDHDNFVYNNDAGMFVNVLTTNPNRNYTTCVTWSDYDEDGYLNLACGNENQANIVYEVRNDSLIQVWSSTPTNATQSAEWTDYDADGDLDLAFGNRGQQNTVYRNDSGTLTTSPMWLTTPSNNTYGMDWGDFDGDGDIDVAYGGNEGIIIYRNTDIWEPSPVSDLSATTASDSSIALSWTATGDDSTVGTASFYDVRYSNLPITAANFGSASPATGEPSPQPPGSTENFEVAGLVSGLKYYFALKVADADTNWSAMSNTANAYVDLDPPEIASIEDVPNDQGKWVTVTWDASTTDHNYGVDQYLVSGYSVWRWMDASAMMAMGEQQPLVLKSEKEFAAWYPTRIESPLIDVQFGGFLAAGTWVFMSTVPALQFETYAVEASTLADSSGQGIPYHTFMVSAMTEHPFVHAESAPDSGYSVDNLSPSPPENLALAGADDIVWDPNSEVDFDYYSIYASTAGGFDPDPEYLVGSTSDTTFTLPDSVLGYFVVVTAIDFNGNESGPSNEIQWATGVEGTHDVPTVYALYQNVPNPFNPTTTIRFDLPEAAAVSLRIFNVRGQLVHTLVDENMSPGVKTVKWDGTDGAGRPVASGIYFYRVRAGNFSDTKKMILLK